MLLPAWKWDENTGSPRSMATCDIEVFRGSLDACLTHKVSDAVLQIQMFGNRKPDRSLLVSILLIIF